MEQASDTAKWTAFEELLSEVSSALADIVSSMETSNKTEAILTEISNSLIDLVSNLETIPKTDFNSASVVIAEAIKQIKIEAPQAIVNNTINVEPTPIENIVNLPELSPVINIVNEAPNTAGWNFTMEYDQSGRISNIKASKE